ncbi:ABC transporter ATP-binding protein [Loktanella sp. S4079]|uniref:ABC transporter ATP-binding protein n=1 Tax=Loktanella sp. S4079 TaxID=579483 RepID=UPI0005FA1C93|nr:ABC transporter ATP-binding protein [Loktanella sp. S4079]KJZ20732.1 iron dicitrate ABC transporter ATP-binding protein [Loktanella sp. S4079]
MTNAAIEVSGLVTGYNDGTVLDQLDLTIMSGEVTAIIGANACGKSTLLRSMSRLLKPRTGRVQIFGQDLHKMPPRKLAQKLGFLPQSPIAPEGITVLDLVSRGRHPHQGVFGRWTPDDQAAVDAALDMTGTHDLAERLVEDLSGGQRQRVWIAMALAQGTEILLLDEPTTYLDINHQIDVLDLLTDLNQERGTTIVMVLHDLNLAARYADRLVAIGNGQVHSVGAPSDILTETMLTEVFGLNARVMADPVGRSPMMVPVGRYKVTNDTGTVRKNAG